MPHHKFTFFCYFLVITFSCSHVTQVEDTKYWSEPTDDASVLYFRMSDKLTIDSILTGKIQYRLEIAQTIDNKLDSIHAMPPWEFGTLLLGISDTLYNRFSTTTLRFNFPPVDSVLDIYMPLSAKKLFQLPGLTRAAVIFDFNKKYNMPVLSEKFFGLEGVWSANPSYTGTLPEGTPFDIDLEIDNSIYKFWFYLNEWYYPNEENYFWEIHVNDDEVVFIEIN